jgi:hypothetical protein
MNMRKKARHEYENLARQYLRLAKQAERNTWADVTYEPPPRSGVNHSCSNRNPDSRINSVRVPQRRNGFELISKSVGPSRLPVGANGIMTPGLPSAPFGSPFFGSLPYIADVSVRVRNSHRK